MTWTIRIKMQKDHPRHAEGWLATGISARDSQTAWRTLNQLLAHAPIWADFHTAEAYPT